MTQEEQKKRSILIAGLMIAMLFAALDGTIVGTAMPRIVGELGGLDRMAWLTTAYLLTSTTIVPIAENWLTCSDGNGFLESGFRFS